MKVDFKKQNVRTFETFYESTGLTEANFLRPLAKLCVQDAGRTPKKITANCLLRKYQCRLPGKDKKYIVSLSSAELAQSEKG